MGQRVSMGFLEGGREEDRPVGEYLTNLVRYVKRKNAPCIEIILRQVCYWTALSL